jgi:hypothetical protein
VADTLGAGGNQINLECAHERSKQILFFGCAIGFARQLFDTIFMQNQYLAAKHNMPTLSESDR